MTIRNDNLGGTDWIANEMLDSIDLNDTFGACDTYTDNIVDNYALPPVGSIIAYHYDFANSKKLIPVGWIECNGNLISDADSIFNGLTSPDLNGTTDADSKFLRGNSTSGTTGGTDLHGHSAATASHTNNVNTYRTTVYVAANYNIPKYFNVKWIMRIK